MTSETRAAGTTALGSLASSEDWPEALPRLLSELTPSLRRMRRRLGVADEDEEDLLQTLAVVALLKAERIRNLRAWLWGSFRHLCLLNLRSRRRRERVRRVLEDSRGETEGVGADRDLPIDLAQRLARLRARPRRALELHYLEGLTLRETAVQLDYAAASMKRTLHRALCEARRNCTLD